MRGSVSWVNPAGGFIFSLSAGSATARKVITAQITATKILKVFIASLPVGASAFEIHGLTGSAALLRRLLHDDVEGVHEAEDDREEVDGQARYIDPGAVLGANQEADEHR